MLWRLLLGFAAAIAILITGEWLATRPWEPEPPWGGQITRYFASGPIQGKFQVTRDWGTGMDACISLTNTSWKTLHDWTVFMAFPRRITTVQGAQLTSQAGSKYRIDSPSGLFAHIPPGGTVQFRFTARPGGWDQLPEPFYIRKRTSLPPSARFNYAAALQMSLYFYEAQRSGPLPETNRVRWRGDSALNDGGEAGIDLTGGYYDAGDHMKFGFPLAGTLTLLSWGGLQYGEGFAKAGEWQQLLDTVRWGTDWLLKAHTAPDELYGQVGEGARDHLFWWPPEQMTMRRPVFKIDSQHPGSDLAGETAAAFASASLLFAREDPAYSARLLEHARQLFTFADTRRSLYSDSIPDAANFYKSSGYEDELIWAALWLYRATNELPYLEKAETLYKKHLAGRLPRGTHTWDDKRYGSMILLAQLTGKEAYRKDSEAFLDFWTRGYNDNQVTYTPGGLAWLQPWGALRYTANTAFLAMIYSDTVADPGNTYFNFARRQINYLLGDNPTRRSYLVGFGRNSAQNPHHRGAHASMDGTKDNPPANTHMLYGALVGGPSRPDDFAFADDRHDECTNEVALDYNAGLTGALARMVILYDTKPLKNFPP